MSRRLEKRYIHKILNVSNDLQSVYYQTLHRVSVNYYRAEIGALYHSILQDINTYN